MHHFFDPFPCSPDGPRQETTVPTVPMDRRPAPEKPKVPWPGKMDIVLTGYDRIAGESRNPMVYIGL